MHPGYSEDEMRKLIRRRGRELDKEHLSRIRQLPCIVCGHHAPSEAAHIRMADMGYGIEHQAMASKPHDWLTLPLCDKHHRIGKQAEHNMGTRAFWRKQGINPIPLAIALYVVGKGRDGLIKMQSLIVQWRAGLLTTEDIEVMGKINGKNIAN